MGGRLSLQNAVRGPSRACVSPGLCIPCTIVNRFPSSQIRLLVCRRLQQILASLAQKVDAPTPLATPPAPPSCPRAHQTPAPLLPVSLHQVCAEHFHQLHSQLPGQEPALYFYLQQRAFGTPWGEGGGGWSSPNPAQHCPPLALTLLAHTHTPPGRPEEAIYWPEHLWRRVHDTRR